MKTNNDNTKLNQWQKRILCVRFIYSVLVSNLTKNEAIVKFQEEIKPLYNDDVNRVIATFFLRKKEIIFEISKHLKQGWTLDRINYVDLAILIEAVCEFISLKIDKKVVIDQAIITAKKYSESNSYKFINSILDKILK